MSYANIHTHARIRRHTQKENPQKIRFSNSTDFESKFQFQKFDNKTVLIYHTLLKERKKKVQITNIIL